MLEIRPPKDHQSHNWRLRNGKLSWEGKIYFCKSCAERQAQQAQGVDPRSAFLYYSNWSSSGAESAHDWLMLHLAFGGGVGSNFGVKTAQWTRTLNGKQLRWWHTLIEKTVYPTVPSLFIFRSLLQTHLTLPDSLFQLYSKIIGMIWEFI
jgi:hypothetical protein